MNIHKKRKKQAYRVLGIMMLLLLVIPLNTSADQTPIVSLKDITIPEGRNEQVGLLISNVENLGSFTINVSWNPSIIDVKDKVNPQNGFEVSSFVDHDHGFVNITAWSLSTLSGTFEPLSLKIAAVGSVGSSSAIQIDFCELLSADPDPIVIPHGTQDGFVQIIEDSSSNGDGGGGNGGGLPSVEPNKAPECNASLSETAGFVDTLIFF